MSAFWSQKWFEKVQEVVLQNLCIPPIYSALSFDILVCIAEAADFV